MRDATTQTGRHGAPVASQNPRTCWLLSAFVVVAGCADDTAPERCAPSPGTAGSASAAEICAACPPGSKLCASKPRAIATAYRLGPPALAWTGAQFGVVWHAMPDRDTPPGIHFALLSPRGERLDDATLLSEARGELYPSIVWNGEHFGVTWAPSTLGPSVSVDSASLPVVAVLEPGQQKRPTGVVLALGLSAGGKLAWSGLEYGVAWTDRTKLRLTRASASGMRANADQVFRDAFDTGIAVAWNGTAFALAWGERDASGETVRVMEVLPDAIEPDPLVVGGLLERPHPRAIEVHALVWTGEEYGLLWSEANDLRASGLYLARIGHGARDPSAVVLVSEAEAVHWSPSLVWTGARFVVAWPEQRGEFQETFVAAYSKELDPLGDPLQLSSSTGSESEMGSTSPALAASELGVMAVWQSNGDSALQCSAGGHLLVSAEVAFCE